jgi:sortase A
MVLIATGILCVLDAVATVVWQEPVTAIYGKVRQGDLGNDLAKLNRTPLTTNEQDVLRELRANRQRIAFLARSMRRRVKDGQPIGRIKIPKIGANFVMVEGTGEADLKKGPGHYPETPFPGMSGTVGVAGHRTTYLAPFNQVDKLRPGDVIRLEMPYATVSYRVERTRIVKPTALWVTRRVGYNRLILSACHPKYSASHRIIVFARETTAVERSRAR